VNVLEEKYQIADETEANLTARIVSAFKTFAAQTPSFKNTEENRSRIFQIMEEMREESGLNPMRAADWSQALARFNYLHDRQPTPNRQQRRVPVKRLSHDDIDQMTSAQYQRRLESDPTFEQQVNALGPRK